MSLLNNFYDLRHLLPELNGAFNQTVVVTCFSMILIMNGNNVHHPKLWTQVVSF